MAKPVIADERDAKVRAVLAASDKPIGPTAIARAIGESWCGGEPGDYPQSSAIVPVLRRIGAERIGTGQYVLPAAKKPNEVDVQGAGCNEPNQAPFSS